MILRLVLGDVNHLDVLGAVVVGRGKWLILDLLCSFFLILLMEFPSLDLLFLEILELLLKLFEVQLAAPELPVDNDDDQSVDSEKQADERDN